MESIIKGNLVSFKTLEQKIFAFFCEQAREATRILLEAYDQELAQTRDKACYRDKGKRHTSIKTVYGTVSYDRRVYQTESEDGRRKYVSLLEETMELQKIGLYSANLAELTVQAAAECPYRVAAGQITDVCGQSISPGGVWNLVQKLGEKIEQEEEEAVRRMEAGQAEGKKNLPVLFEEMDGVWLPMRDAKHRKAKKKEMKVFTMYEGWDATDTGRSRLVGKQVLAGIEGSQEFHRKREALVEKTYQVEEIGLRVLNGDGGSWIREEYDPEAIFQLDRYHVHQETLRKIRDKTVQKEIRRNYEEEDPGAMLACIEAYARQMEEEGEEKEAEKARGLYQYFWNNREGLLPWDRQGIRIPEAPEGIVYRRMGVQENQNCTLLTRRMKHRRMSWSKEGANHLAKILCREENGELGETVRRYTDGWIRPMEIREAGTILSAGKVPKKEGKGDSYVEKISCHMPLLDAIQTAGRKALRAALPC